MDAFLGSVPLLDVRSPGEFQKGHIPCAISFPLFSDEERAQVGTTYKQESRAAAIELGLRVVGPKMAGMVAQARELASDNQLNLYCWRGGMRSQSAAHLLRMVGLHVRVLEGGYKAFRHWSRELFAQAREVRVLAGFSGAGKTAILKALEQQGEAIVDLEELACHRGSSFGQLGQPAPPTQEHFENRLACALYRVAGSPLWIEDESRMIGQLQIPQPLFNQMQAAPTFLVECPKEERIQRLLDDYGHLPHQGIKEAIERLRKRLGGQRTTKALQAVNDGDARQVVELVLDYYDKGYAHCMTKCTGEVVKVKGAGLSEAEWADRILEVACDIGAL